MNIISRCVLWFTGLACSLTPLAGEVRLTDIEYGKAAGESLRLDVYVPSGPGPFPVAILVHGGGWRSGDKSGGPRKANMVPMHEPLERAGFAWFSINYRLAPKHRYPAPVEDVETAIRWVKAHAAEYHLDLARIVLSGESAGAHLAAMAVVRADDATRVAAVVPFYGVFDLPALATPGAALNANFVVLFGREQADGPAMQLLREASPFYHIKPALPPFLLVHGTADLRVPLEQSVKMKERLHENGVRADLLTVPNAGHGMFGWEAGTPDYREQVIQWLQTVFAPAVTAQKDAQP